jgi:hypothetical protein
MLAMDAVTRRVRYHAPLRVSEKSVRQRRCQSYGIAKDFSGYAASKKISPDDASNQVFACIIE